MAEKTTSQAQHGSEMFQNLVDEMAKLEEKGMAQARAGIDEAAKLWKESLGYAAQLNAEWRRLSLEAVRRASELVSPRS